MKKLLILVLSLFLYIQLQASEPIKREMRGAWVATIYGLDWPSKSGTDAATIAAQKAEMNRLLDRLQAAGINAVMFQVRTFSDAMYRSTLEPWAVALTGSRGTAPADKEWDPLQYAINEAHARGMELHAWVNPFRYSTKSAPYTDKFDRQMRPWLISYTPRQKSKRDKPKTTVILDPGNPAARDHVIKVCRDIVSRYDIDGLIFDDYFYPDRLPLGAGYDYNEWKKSGTGLSQADWRRENVNTTIKAVYDMIQEEKPYVNFGISPAGVGGGNGVSSSQYGLEPCTGNDWMYERIYCDPLAWLDGGYVDYISPQIYWNRDHSTNPYQPIATWWSNAATHFGRHFYASHSLSSFANAGGDNTEAWRERGAQVEINRSLSDNPGSIFYAARNINGFGNHLAQNHYTTPALVPSREWKEAQDPGPVTDIKLKGNTLSWRPVNDLCRYIVYAIPTDIDILDAMSPAYGGISASYLLGITYTPSYSLPSSVTTGHYYIIAPLDRYGNEWQGTEIVKSEK